MVRSPRPAWTHVAFLLLLLPLLLAASCVFKGVAIQEPAQNELQTDDVLRFEGRVATQVDPLSVAVLLDGVDLIQHFGLVPPFFGQGGNVMIGGDLVAVSNFDFDPAAGIPQMSLDASGFSPGPHDIEITGFRPSDATALATSRDFTMVGPLDEKAGAIVSSGLPHGSAGFGGFLLGNASSGDVSAGVPVSYPDGSELRAGVVEVIEARLAGGTP